MNPLPPNVWGQFLDARAYLVRCARDAGRTPREILDLCNFDSLAHVELVLANVRTGGPAEAQPPKGFTP